MVKQERIRPAISGITDKNEIKRSQSSIDAFETKEEFIAHLIKIGEVKISTRSDNTDGCIYLQGCLKIDKRVKKFLSWNDVVVTSAVVEPGMVSRYQYLPRTEKGVTTTLRAPDLKSYMEHNNYGAEYRDNKWYVNTLRIPESATHLDFSNVNAELTLFYGHQISLSSLPYSKNILGLSPYSLGIDCPNARKLAQQKGCGKEILKALPAPNPLAGFIDNIGGIFSTARR